MKKQINWKIKLFLTPFMLSPIILAACGNPNSANVDKNDGGGVINPTPPSEQQEFSKLISAVGADDTKTSNEDLVQNLKTNLGINANNQLTENNNLIALNYYLATKDQLTAKDISNISEVTLALDKDQTTALYDQEKPSTNFKLNFVLKFKKNYLFQQKFSELKIAGDFNIKINNDVVLDLNNLFFYAYSGPNWKDIEGTTEQLSESNVVKYVTDQRNATYSNPNKTWAEKMYFLLQVEPNPKLEVKTKNPFWTHSEAFFKLLPTALKSVILSNVKLDIPKYQTYNTSSLIRYSSTFTISLKNGYVWKEPSSSHLMATTADTTPRNPDPKLYPFSISENKKTLVLNNITFFTTLKVLDKK